VYHTAAYQIELATTADVDLFGKARVIRRRLGKGDFRCPRDCERYSQNQRRRPTSIHLTPPFTKPKTCNPTWLGAGQSVSCRPEELFTLDPGAPIARYDRMGLIWMLHGETVIQITATAAKLSGGLTFSPEGLIVFI
jgi:hypothetical protein